MKSLFRFNALLFVLFLISCTSQYAQEPIGGPYTADANTLVLLHFDDNFDNESSLAPDGVGHTNAGTAGLVFLTSPLGTGMGKCLRLKNDAISDSSYVSVPDADVLDLLGDWTIEGWINVFTFGETSGDHRWVPRLCIKTGDANFWQPNWWVELWGDNRWFQTGFHTADQANWPAITSSKNVMVPGQWVHLTFIRDDTRKIIIQMIHNNNRQLVYFGSMSYANLPVTTPITTSQDVHIGWAGPGSADSWLDGFVDEIRISNNVRNFAVPPIITDVTQLPNQSSTVTGYEINAKVMAFSQTGTITSANIKYSLDKGVTWQTVAMTNSGNDYTGTIPQQPFGSIIRYYVEATDNGGLTSTYPTSGVDPLQFAIYKPNMMVLSLDFEEGTGAPVDKSAFGNPVTSPRPFTYSSTSRTGTYSYLMESDASTNLDSSFLEVDAPFLTSLDFNVDFWFRADSIKQYIRLINRPIATGNWFQNNYEIRLEDTPHLRARYYVDPQAPNRTGDYIELDVEDSIEVNKWYRAVFKRDSLKAVFQVYDENNVLLGETINDTSVTVNPPVQPNIALRIGNGGNVNGTRGFEGRIDDVKIYNNSEGITTGVEENNSYIPDQYALSQNFPNPFNPATTITFSLPKAGNVNLTVYDIMGRKVKTLVNERLHVGSFDASWDGRNEAGISVSSGVYFYKLKTDDVVLSKKMVLIK